MTTERTSDIKISVKINNKTYHQINCQTTDCKLFFQSYKGFEHKKYFTKIKNVYEQFMKKLQKLIFHRIFYENMSETIVCHLYSNNAKEKKTY